MHRLIGLPYFTPSLLWQTCAPLCMPHQILLPYFTSSILWLAFTLFTCSCCWLTPFLILTRRWCCLCCCRNSSCSCNLHYTNWKLLVAEECCRGRLYAQMILQWWYGVNNFEVQNTDMKVCGWRLPGKRIVVCSASKMTTHSSVCQSGQVVVNSMLRQQGDNTLIIYQSCHDIVKQDDSHYKWLTLLRFNLRIWLSPSWILPSAANAFPASVPKKWAISGKWDDSHFLICHTIPVCRHLLFIELPYHSRYVLYVPMWRWLTLSLYAFS